MKQNINLGIWHRLTQLMAVLLVAALLLGVFFWYLPLFQQNARMRRQILLLQEQIAVEERKQRDLQTSIHNLREDPKTVERMAREKLGYARHGETVIYFEAPRSGNLLR